MDRFRQSSSHIVKPFLSTQKRKISAAVSAVLVLALLCWALSGGPVHPQLVALVKPLVSGTLTGSDPPTLDSLRKYRAQALKAYLGSFKEPFKQEDWQKFLPVIHCPKSRPLTKYGQGDGSKLLCRTQGLANRPDGSPCIIYSLGSNGDYQFEQAMLESTTCDVHTFDCTFAGQSVDGDQRHHYHKWCIGKGGADWKTWPEITSALRHSSVDLLKIDVEGHEYPVLAGFKPTDALPQEISMEIHMHFAGGPATPAELAFVFLHMANLGYVAYAQEVNEIAPHCCSEFTFLRVSNVTEDRK